MLELNLKLDKRFYTLARGVFEQYAFDVGVLQNKVYRSPKPELKSFLGGQARKVGKASGLTVADVSERLRKNTKINFYTKPFSLGANRDLLDFLTRFFRYCSGKGELRRVENSLQAVVRNPILRGDYGRNTAATAAMKGFNRFMIDTGQLFRSIKAKAVKNVSK